ncbi:MAG: glycosyltransferase family 2 protein [Candidatus Omnitrophica bacterium]|nr:glycosyltransferase family 2 protein [Candidatus Omnitrophota bacterium]
MKDQVEISIVSPVFNEEAGIDSFYRELKRVCRSGEIDHEIIFVDDGSRDNSFLALARIRQEDPQAVRVIRLARNFGHQLAITAGIRAARGKAVVVLDSDLQDPPAVIPEFIKRWREGNEVVYGRRTERKGETWFKKWTAHVFYRLIRAAAKVDIAVDSGDFYLLDRKVVDIINSMEERHRFIRGLIAWMGFRRYAVGYVRQARQAGQTKFSIWKMGNFALDAVISFSFAPLRVASIAGAGISFLAFLGILATIYIKLFTQLTVQGWSSLMIAILFIGGIQLLAIGLIGEYVARIGDDVKHRPLYTVQETLE